MAAWVDLLARHSAHYPPTTHPPFQRLLSRPQRPALRAEPPPTEARRMCLSCQDLHLLGLGDRGFCTQQVCGGQLNPRRHDVGVCKHGMPCRANAQATAAEDYDQGGWQGEPRNCDCFLDRDWRRPPSLRCGRKGRGRKEDGGGMRSDLF